MWGGNVIEILLIPLKTAIKLIVMNDLVTACRSEYVFRLMTGASPLLFKSLYFHKPRTSHDLYTKCTYFLISSGIFNNVQGCITMTFRMTVDNLFIELNSNCPNRRYTKQDPHSIFFPKLNAILSASYIAQQTYFIHFTKPFLGENSMQSVGRLHMQLN